MKPPKNVKDIQKLTGCMAALSRYIARLGDKGLPFFKLLKASEKFVWSQEADRAFEDLKKYLTSPPCLAAPTPNEHLYLYITATNSVVSTVIVIERQDSEHAFPVQRPVYYISEVLTESKVHYNHVQKFLYAVLITSRKLRHYFEHHPITVVTEFPLRDILRNKDANGRIVKWAIEMSMFTLDFKGRKTI